MQYITETANIERMENSRDTVVCRFIYYNFNTLFDEVELFEQLSNRTIMSRFEQEVDSMVQHLRSHQQVKCRIYRSTLAAMLSYNFDLSLAQVKWVLRDTYALEKIAKDYGGIYSTEGHGARLMFEENNTCSLVVEVL